MRFKSHSEKKKHPKNLDREFPHELENSNNPSPRQVVIKSEQHPHQQHHKRQTRDTLNALPSVMTTTKRSQHSTMPHLSLESISTNPMHRTFPDKMCSIVPRFKKNVHAWKMHQVFREPPTIQLKKWNCKRETVVRTVHSQSHKRKQVLNCAGDGCGHQRIFLISRRHSKPGAHSGGIMLKVTATATKQQSPVSLKTVRASGVLDTWLCGAIGFARVC